MKKFIRSSLCQKLLWIDIIFAFAVYMYIYLFLGNVNTYIDEIMGVLLFLSSICLLLRHFVIEYWDYKAIDNMITEKGIRTYDGLYDKIKKIEVEYRTIQNHREKLGSAFLNCLKENGATSDFYIGMIIEDIILHLPRSEKEIEYVNSTLKSYCGYSFEELVEQIKE